MRRAGRAVLVLATLGACAPAARVRRPDAALSVECPVGEARVYVDDVFVGRADELAARAVPVRSGALRLEVRADGYFSAYRDVPVARGARARVRVPLHRVPAGEPGG